MGYMSNNSTSARAFSQMFHGVRNLKDENPERDLKLPRPADNILIYIGDVYYSENTILYYPECLENNLLESYDTKSGLGNIQKYNKCEELNTKYYLLNDFVNIIERKGYEWEILKDKAKKSEKCDYTNRIEGIDNAKIMQEYEYKILIEKQKEGKLNEGETYILDKYFMSKKFVIDIEKIDEEFIEEHFRNEYLIDNYKQFIKKEETIEKNFDNDLLQDKVEKINKIVSWFIDKEGNNQDIKSEDLRTNFIGFFKDPSIKQLFCSYPKKGGNKNIFNNVSNHILKELGFELQKKRKQYKDKLTGKMKEYNNYTIGTCEILTNYLKRVEEKEKNEEELKNNIKGL